MANLHQHDSVIVWVFLALSIQAACAHEPASPVDGIRARYPSVLVPGATTPILDADQPGYYVCTLVARYFDDETVADLRLELDLTARQQFVRFMQIGRTGDAGNASLELRGFRNIGTWWEGDSLHALYFVPEDGLHWLDASGSRQPSISEATKSGASQMLLDARAQRKREEFQSARNSLGQLRREFPSSPEARRALRELYFVNTAESRRRTGKEDAP